MRFQTNDIIEVKYANHHSVIKILGIDYIYNHYVYEQDVLYDKVSRAVWSTDVIEKHGRKLQGEELSIWLLKIL